MIGAVLLVAGYAVAVPLLAFLRSAFTRRRTSTVVAFEAGMAAIVAGWWVRREPVPLAINAAALAGVAVAWWVTGRRRAAGRGRR